MLKNNRFFFPGLFFLLIVTLLFAISSGAVPISLANMYGALQSFFCNKGPANIYEGVFLQIRMPRVLLCAITGAVLAASGVLMQGLFRNPIVEPGLIGTSAGAAFGASVVFVLAANMGSGLKSITGPLLVPIFAFLGGLLATFLVYTLARNFKKPIPTLCC